jgi:hypothetical protein
MPPPPTSPGSAQNYFEKEPSFLPHEFPNELTGILEFQRQAGASHLRRRIIAKSEGCSNFLESTSLNHCFSMGEPVSDAIPPCLITVIALRFTCITIDTKSIKDICLD